MIEQGKKCLQWRHHNSMNSGVVCDHSGPLYTHGIGIGLPRPPAPPSDAFTLFRSRSPIAAAPTPMGVTPKEALAAKTVCRFEHYARASNSRRSRQMAYTCALA